MIKIIFLFIGCILVQTLAGNYDWYPANADDIKRKCNEENPLSAETIEQMKHGQINDTPAFRALILCLAKGLTVYTTEQGFDSDRLAFAMYRNGATRQCQRQRTRECIDKQKDIKPEGDMVFGVMKCIVDLEMEKIDEDGPPSEWKGCN